MNPKIAKLLAQRKTLKAECDALLVAAEKENRDLNDDESPKFDANVAAIKKIETQVERLRSLDEITASDDQPISQRTQSLQPGQGDQHIADVGDLTAATPKAPIWKSLGEQLHAVRQHANGVFDPRLQLAPTGQGETQPSDGGFLLMAEQSSELLQKTYAISQVASRITMNLNAGAGANSIKIPAVDETSRANGSRWGGLRAYWADEAASVTASVWAPRIMELKLHNLRGLLYLTDELLEDVPAMQSYVESTFPLEFSFKMDDALINGTGAGKPLGVLNAAATISIAKETGQAASTVVWANIKKMWARMYAPSRANAVWFINQDVEPQLFSMSEIVGTGGVPVYLPPGGASVTPFASLLGRPVVPIEQCATLGSLSDILFCDFSQYVAYRKGGLKADSSIHVRFINHETAFRFTLRVDAQPLWNSPLTPFKGTNSQSPFISLAARA